MGCETGKCPEFFVPLGGTELVVRRPRNSGT